MTMPQTTSWLARLVDAQRLFERLDDGAGGPVQTFKRRTKFRWRYVRHGQHLHSVAEHIRGLGLSQHLAADPAVPLRSMRPYLWSGLSGQGRAEALKHHLAWLVTALAPGELTVLYQRGYLVLREWEVGSNVLRLVLQPGRALGREGELELHLQIGGVSAVRASFSVLPASAVGAPLTGPLMVIGNMQGAADGRELVKQLAGAMEKIRPSHVLLNALQGLAQGWGLAGMVGVSTRGHVYAGYGSLRKRVGICYDSLWQELGASDKASRTHWQLPLHWQPKPLEEVASKKRSELRRRNALRQQVLGDCRSAAQRLAVPAAAVA